MRELDPAREREWRDILVSEGLQPTVRAEAIPVPVWTRLAGGSPSAA
jgi:hypothetical protein